MICPSNLLHLNIREDRAWISNGDIEEGFTTANISLQHYASGEDERHTPFCGAMIGFLGSSID